MSLDIYFNQKIKCPKCEHVLSGEQVFWKNITHNLSRMADSAGFYNQLWHPENTDVVTAKDLSLHLEKGIKELKSNPDKYKQLSASNGWGTYEQFIPWLEELLAACNEYPDSIVTTST